MLAAVLAGPASVSAQPSQVGDLFPGTSAAPASTPQSFAAFGTDLYFRANETAAGAELYRSDGTGAGTERISDLYLGADSGLFTPLGTANGRLIYMAKDGTEESSLWAIDGVGPPVRLLPVTGIYGGLCLYPVVVSDVLYCLIRESQRVLRSDGTAAGTFYISPPGRSLTSRIGVLGGDLYYLSAATGGPAKLYRNDGTLEGETEIMDFGAGSAVNSTSREVLAAGSLVYFSVSTSAHGAELWRTDGTGTGTVLVKDISLGAGSSYPRAFAALGSLLLFNAADSNDHGFELWRSDGTETGTVLVEDIRPGTLSSAYSRDSARRVVGSTLFFVANDGSHGLELWRSDGTEPGTNLVADVYTGVGSSMPDGLLELAGSLYFRARSETGGIELWRSDGTPGGTAPVVDLLPGIGDGLPATHLPGLFGSAIYFAGDDGGGAGFELWRTDGTADGTGLVADLAGGPGDGVAPATSEPGPWSAQARWGDWIYFAGDDGLHGRELWVSDGTPAGTSMMLDIAPGATGSWPCQFQKAGNRLYFFADDGVHGFELWSSDGTAGGTSMVADLGLTQETLGFGVYNRGRTTLALNGRLLFLSSGQVWASDGTETGTVALPGSLNSWQYDLAALDGFAYFMASDSTLWRTDGTPAGTGQVTADSSCCYEGPMLRVGSRLLFEGLNSSSSYGALWATDGTAAGTQRVLDWASDTEWRASTGSLLFLVGNDGIHGNELWKSDGTPGGAFIVKDIQPGSASSAPHFTTAVGDLVFFAADDGVHGVELWKSDGTEANTSLVKDIAAGSESSWPACLREINGLLYFAATDNASGMELWRSDGSEAGTVPLGDIAPGVTSSSPCEFLEVGGRLLFSAYDAADGRELWAVPEVSGRVLRDGFESGDTNAWTFSTSP